MTKKDAIEVADFLSDALQNIRPAAKALLAWSAAGCPKTLPPEILAAMKEAIPGAECAKASGALWAADEDDDAEALDAIN